MAEGEDAQNSLSHEGYGHAQNQEREAGNWKLETEVHCAAGRETRFVTPAHQDEVRPILRPSPARTPRQLRRFRPGDGRGSRRLRRRSAGRLRRGHGHDGAASSDSADRDRPGHGDRDAFP